VANGNSGKDSTVSVIDSYTDKVIQTVNVADGACNMVSPDNQNIWIICQGQKVYNEKWEVIKETDSHLVKMSASDYSIKYSKIIGVKGDGCSPFLISSDKLGNIYYVEADGVHKINTKATNLEDKLLIPWENSSGLSIYGMNVDPKTSNIYVLDPNGFAAAGKFHIYNAMGSLIRSFDVGIAPNGAVSF
jgi:DNA-binding beta-propeller fold protein YncE